MRFVPIKEFFPRRGGNPPASASQEFPIGVFRLSTFARFCLALAIFLVASVFALLQAPRPNALESPRFALSTAWWRYPLEWNAPSRLAKIECGLNAIYAVPGTTQIWAAGNKGMVVQTTDGGQTWTRKGIETRQIPVAPTPSPLASPPVPASMSSTTLLDLPDLVPTAHAAVNSEDTQKPVSQPPQGTLPTFTPYPVVRRPVATPTPVRPSVRRPANANRSAGPVQNTTGESSSPTARPSPSSGGGRSSSIEIEPEEEQLIAVYFVDDKRGEVISKELRFITADGGATWQLENRFPKTIIGTAEVPGRFLISDLWIIMFVQIMPTNSGHSEYLTLSRNYIYTQNSPDSFLINSPNDAEFVSGFRFESGVNSLFFLSGKTVGWVVGSEGRVFRTFDSGKSFETHYTQTSDDLYSVFFINEYRGWVAGANGVIRTTKDGGLTWQQQDSGTKSQLNSINFISGGQYGWIAGNDGLILSTQDGGATWVHRTQGVEGNGGRYFCFPAPWYFLSLLLVAGLLMRRPAEEPAKPPEDSVAPKLVSDRPLEEAGGDVLAFNAIARGLSQFLRNENTLPPLTIAVIGEWGTGKSSLMNLLRADLRSFKFRPVWFNAWHHQKEEHMLASLLENIKLQAVPRWWTTRGVMFRVRLLKIRGWRQWGPLAVLLFALYVVLVYHFVMHGTYMGLTNFTNDVSKFFGTAQGGEKLETGQYVRALPLVVSLAPFVFAIWRGMTAFGVKPASLLANVSSGVNIRGLEAQTSFRQKFAVQFNDVTRALGKRSMLIFIDDLDRCRPENVLETLEAVNFLTTSGDCFVVIGMAREYVERCVGRAFKEVAEEMIDELPDQSPSPTARQDATQVKEEIAKEKRIEFARQYLDKLINIEVPVPAPKQAQSLALLIASTKELPEPTAMKRLQRLKLSVVNLVEKQWHLVPLVLAVGGLLVLGYYVARGLRGDSSTVKAPDTTATAVPTPTSAPTSAASPSAQVSPGLAVSPSPMPTVATAATNEQPRLLLGGRGFFSTGMLPVLFLLVLLWIGSAMLTRRPGLVVKDSPKFIDALRIWHPVVFARQSTPRATKRFMNHVRYLAMRQRQPRDTQQPLKRFTSRLKNRLTGVPTHIDIATLPEPNVQIIPDEVLVALAAIHHLNSECLEERPSPKQSLIQVWPRPVDENSLYFGIFDEARTAHNVKFGNWAQLNQYRDRFLEMTANVQVR